MKGRPTLKDIAEIARVSEMTVSRVLREAGEASPETVRRVKAVAAEIGYMPHRIAGALSSKTVNLVGVVVPSVSSFVFSEVLTGISEGLRTTAKQAVFSVTGYDPEIEESAIREMLSWRPAGLIIAGLEHTDACRTLLKSAGIPVVEIMDVDGAPVDMNVGISHVKAGAGTARELLARGYRRIGFVGTKMPHDFRAAKRLTGFRRALAAEGFELVAEEHYSGGSSMRSGKELTARILERRPDIDCLYYSSDMLSCGGVIHCIESGRAMPGDLAIAGFNGMDIRLAMPRVPATCNAYRLETGRTAAELVLDAVDGDPAAMRKVVEFESRFEPGDTV